MRAVRAQLSVLLCLCTNARTTSEEEYVCHRQDCGPFKRRREMDVPREVVWVRKRRQYMGIN